VGWLKCRNDPVNKKDNATKDAKENAFSVSETNPDKITSANLTKASQNEEAHRLGDLHVGLLSIVENLGWRVNIK
jgi:hypothetical protein